MKTYKFKIDDWVLYEPYFALQERVSTQSCVEEFRAVVLEVLENDLFYDYRIFIDGSGTITKVREENLFPCEETT
jgi:hypothetical protein